MLIDELALGKRLVSFGQRGEKHHDGSMARTRKMNLYMLVMALYPIISITESIFLSAANSSLPDDGVPVARLMGRRPFSWSSNGAASVSSLGTSQSAQRQPHALQGIDDPIRRGATAASRER